MFLALMAISVALFGVGCGGDIPMSPVAPVAMSATSDSGGDGRVHAMTNGTLFLQGDVYTDDWDSGALVDSGYYLWIRPAGTPETENVLYHFVNNPVPGYDGYLQESLPAGTYTVTYNNIPENQYPALCNPSVPSFNVTITGGQTTSGNITWDDMTTCDLA
jgi:hypothetical protein